MGLYIVSAVVGWRIKEGIGTPATVSIFVALGMGGTIGGVLRGHLLFTERMNRSNLAGERRRVARTITFVDVLLGAALVADATLVAPGGPVAAVLTMSLGLGLALAALVLETATTRAAFGGN
jgi:hypothetical protein